MVVKHIRQAKTLYNFPRLTLQFYQCVLHIFIFRTGSKQQISTRLHLAAVVMNPLRHIVFPYDAAKEIHLLTENRMGIGKGGSGKSFHKKQKTSLGYGEQTICFRIAVEIIPDFPFFVKCIGILRIPTIDKCEGTDAILRMLSDLNHIRKHFRQFFSKQIQFAYFHHLVRIIQNLHRHHIFSAGMQSENGNSVLPFTFRLMGVHRTILQISSDAAWCL